MVESYLLNSHGETHTAYKMAVMEVFTVDRQGERDRFKDVGNKLVVFERVCSRCSKELQEDRVSVVYVAVAFLHISLLVLIVFSRSEVQQCNVHSPIQHVVVAWLQDHEHGGHLESGTPRGTP